MPLVRSAALLIGSRLGCMLIGLVGIPVLLSGLGTQSFSAWAVFLGGSFLFYNLELAMPPTVIRFLSADRATDQGLSTDAVMNNATVLLMAVYLTGFVLLTAVAEPVARWLNLPDTPLMRAGNLIRFVFAAVAVCSILKLGVSGLHTIERFDFVALVDLAQVGLASLLAWGTAHVWHRLDLTIFVFWLGQMAVLSVARFRAKRLMPWRFALSMIRLDPLKKMLRHGVNLQFGDLAFFSHFQIDKFIISGLVGLTEVAHYEVTSRVSLALRNLPAAGFRVLLPQATSRFATGRANWQSYLETTRLAGFAALFFLVGPLLVSPLFLFAWVGQIGFHGRWVFMWLAMGMMASVLAMPVGIFIQAEGQTGLERRKALFAIPVHLVASLLLALQWGKEGVAFGTGVTLVMASLLYARRFHRINGQRLGTTFFGLVKSFWPAIPVCLLTFGGVFWTTPLVIGSRWHMAPASILCYGFFAVTLWAVFRLSGRIGPVERDFWQTLCRTFSTGLGETGKEIVATELKIALVETAPSWPPGSMTAYADLVDMALSSENGLQIERINLAPPVRLANRIPALRGIWGRHLWAMISGPLRLRLANAAIYHVLDGGYAYLGACCPRKPVVVTAHDLIPLMQMKGRFSVSPPSRLGRLILRRSLAGLAGADRVVAVSGNTKRDLQTEAGIGKDRIDLVLQAIPIPYVQKARRKPPLTWAARVKRKAAFILSVANNGYYKNRIGVLRIFAKIRKSADIRLRMAGPAPTREMLAFVKKADLAHWIDFEIDPDHEDLAEMYRNAALFLFPSLYEGFGWPPLEAMLFGCPVVCSNTASLPEVVGDAALTAPPEDNDALARLCLSVLENEKLAEELIAEGLGRVEEFSLERMREGIVAVYREALGDVI